jgi:streptogramin lyase
VFGLVVLAVVAGLAVAVPSGRAEDSPYLNVWVHYDYMVGQGYSDAPNPASIQMVVDAFKAHGVTLHIDPQHTAIPAHAAIVPDWQSRYASTPGFDDPSCTGPDAVLFSQLQAQYFQPSSNHPWHYAIFGNDLFSSSLADVVNCPRVVENGNNVPNPSMAGYSQVGFLDVPGGFGYGVLINMKVWRDLGIDVNAPENARIVAALFMHELGHNLGLCHGGPNLDGTDPTFCIGENYKPNYISVMNYFFEFGIPVAATPGSTTIAGWRVDYSDVALPDLNQSCLNETAGLQDTAHPTDISRQYGGPSPLVPALGPVDWNSDGNTTDTCLQHALSPFEPSGVLHGADDWAWLHSRLTPTAVTGFSPGFARVGDCIQIKGVNLMWPATVVFAGGATTMVSGAPFSLGYDMSPNTRFPVCVPAGAKSGPITVITPEGKAVSSQTLTILTDWHSPEAITTGPDGNLWFTEEVGSNSLGQITPTGTVTQFSILSIPPALPAGPGTIAAGPDGNLWLVDLTNNAIDRVTPGGQETQFPLPTPASGPQSITAGPDGNLWFTEYSGPANSIGRITPAGTITEFPLPSSFSFPQAITAGPDGNLWFTELTNKIGRITPSGTITEFSIATTASGDYEAITAGPDGNLWFTENQASNGVTSFQGIGRITTAGAITQFALPNTDSFPAGITAGPDGNVWFTESQTNQIGRITPSGAITEFPVPDYSSSPTGIIAGPDGNLWFTESYGNSVGRITPSGKIIEFPIP